VRNAGVFPSRGALHDKIDVGGGMPGALGCFGVVCFEVPEMSQYVLHGRFVRSWSTSMCLLCSSELYRRAWWWSKITMEHTVPPNGHAKSKICIMRCPVIWTDWWWKCFSFIYMPCRVILL
jgi:hypothetical protein